MPFSYNGWQAPPHKTKVFTVPGTNRKLTLDEQAGRILTAWAADYHKYVRPIDDGGVDEGGYCYRPANASPSQLSCHASGTAVDLNWSKEGAGWSAFAKSFWANAKNKANMARIKMRYASVLRFGIDWSGKNWDPMHAEIKKGVSVADVQRFCRDNKIDENGVRKGA